MITVLTIFAVATSILFFLDIVVNIKSFRIKKPKSEAEIEYEKQEKLKAQEKQEYKDALKEYCANPINSFVTSWVNLVLNDGVRKVTPDENDCYSIIETKNYIMHYWTANKFYDYGFQGKIYDKNEYPSYPSDVKDKAYIYPEVFLKEKKPIMTWRDQMTDKETRYRIFSIIKGFEKINNK